VSTDHAIDRTNKLMGKHMARYFVTFITDALGRCPKCMRTSFLAAISSSVFAIAITVMANYPSVVAMSWIAAVALVGLWIAHLVAYSVRATAFRIAIPEGQGATFLSRREIFPTFFRALGAMALTTALPAATAFAQSRCDCSKCRSDQKCCPTANGYCGCFPGSIQC
jgi:hypothetical protein